MVFASIAYGQSPIRVTITTNDGTVYENARITSDTDSELIIINKDGANTIPKSKLSDADKVRFNYDPEKEKVLIAKRDEAAEHWKQSQTEQTQRQEAAKADSAKKAELLKKASVQRFMVSEITDEGVIVGGVEAYSDADLSMLNNPYMSTKDRVAIAKQFTRYRMTPSRFFVVDYPKDGLVDRAIIYGYFIEDGTHSYSSLSGSNRTVKRFRYIAPAKEE